MTTKGTIYARPRWAGMSPGMVTAMDGNGFPVYREPRRPMKGSGIVASLGRAAKRSARKLTRSRALGGLKRKIGAQLKRKIGTQLKGKIGAQMKKKANAAVTRRVNRIRPAPSTVKRNIRNELSKDIRKLTPKRSIKGGPSHNEVVRRAERMIYSGANF